MRLFCSLLILWQAFPVCALAQAVASRTGAGAPVILPAAGQVAAVQPSVPGALPQDGLAGLASLASALPEARSLAFPGALDAAYDGWPVRPASAALPELPQGAAERTPFGRIGEAPAAAPGPVQEPPAPAPASGWKRSLRFAPDVLTGLNLFSGLAATVLAAAGSAVPAVGLILLANVFDLMDGRAARALGATSPMGIELDSLADIVSFGAAPAVLLWATALSPLGAIGAAAASIYAFAGAYRLARFNLYARAPKAEVPAPAPDSFTGLPIPGGAGVVSGFVLALPFIAPVVAPALAAVVAVAAAAAMVSTLPYPAFKKGGWKAMTRPVGVALGVAAPLAALGLHALIPAAVFGLYLLTGPAARWLSGTAVAAPGGELKTRALTAVPLAAVILSSIYAGGLAFSAFSLAVAAMMLVEYGSLLEKGGKPVHRWTTLAVGSALGLATVLGGPMGLLWPAAAGVILLRELFAREHSLERAALTLFGAALLGGLLPYLALIRALPDGGILTALIFASVWFMDGVAMLAGQGMGRHKLAPVVSPGKTWEGAVMGSAAALGVALLFNAFFPVAVPFWTMLAVGLSVAVLGPLSDLGESVVKRSVGAKDSGDLLPGHGGFMDRFDSYVLIAPVLYALLKLLGY